MHARMVLHFWVAQWMLRQEDAWTRKQLSLEFQASYPTARDWASAAQAAGLVTATKKGSTVWFRRTS